MRKKRQNGSIANDFHDRKDLTPNICAVYTEEAYRGRGIAGRRRSGALKDVCAPVRYGAIKNVCAPVRYGAVKNVYTPVRRGDGRKRDEYRKKEYGILPPSRSV